MVRPLSGVTCEILVLGTEPASIELRPFDVNEPPEKTVDDGSPKR